MYVITGATGNTGKPLTLALLAAGKEVRIISRSAEKAQDLVDKGAHLFVGDTAQPETLGKAFDGATAVYAMIPPDFSVPDLTAHQRKHADALAAAIKKAAVTYVVSLSSVGAHLKSDSGVVLGLRHMEQQFDRIEALNTLHLRPTYFMENTLGMIGMIKQMGAMGSPVDPNCSLSMIATRDIAEYAARRLLSLDFAGKNHQYLLGPRDLTYSEVTGIYGRAINSPDLKYVPVPFEDFKGIMINYAGASENTADRMNEFIRALNAGSVLEEAVRTPEATTPTTIEEFAKMFSQVYSS
jgi:uncharacterized protein YbjT (DUF2867 family)